MSLSAATLMRLAALSLQPEQMSEVLRIIADMQAVEDDRKAKQRSRTAKNRGKTVTVTKDDRDGNGDVTLPKRDDDVTGDVTPVLTLPPKETPPAPPKEITPNPDLPENKNLVGSPAAKKRQAPNRALAYPPEFELVWREYPFHPNASKKLAYLAWQDLPEEDRDKCFDGALAYGRFLDGERQKRPEYPGQHLVNFIKQRKFESLLEVRQ